MTSQPLSPSQLPQANAQFIAYGPATRVPDPDGSGESVTIRPQVLVRYYRGAVIKDVNIGGRNGGDTVAVHIDPESVGLSEPITGYLGKDDPIVQVLQDAQENAQPVDIALEVARKAKAKSSKQPISPLTPIQALRGADHPNGNGTSSTMMGASAEHIRNLFAMVNGRGTKSLISDPTEWATLTGNKEGRLAPEGWRIYAPGAEEDWKVAGAITPSDTPARGKGSNADGAGFDTNLLSGIVAKTLTEVLIKAGVIQPPTVEGDGPARVRGRKFAEGRQWDARTNDGRINLGSYLSVGTSDAARWAHSHLATNGHQVDQDTVWALAERALTVGDHVQADAYGHGVEPNRADASHREAMRWVQWAADNADLPYPLTGTDEAREDWSRAVYAVALENLTHVGQVVAGHLAARTKRTAAPARIAQEDTPSGPSPVVVKAILDAITRAWDKRDAIQNIGTQNAERGFNNLPVSVAYNQDGEPTLTYPAVEGQETLPLNTILGRRWKELDAAAPVQPVASESAPPPAAVAEAPTTGSRDDVLAAIIERANAAADESALREVFNDARAANVLNAQVYTNLEAPRPVAGLTPDSGADTGTLAQVLDGVRVFLTQTQSTQVVAGASEPDAAAAENVGGLSPQQDAQRIADAASTAVDIEALTGLEAYVAERGLDTVQVTIGRNSGSLAGYLRSRRKHLAMTSAA